jgi:hypothetical protein
MWEDDYINDIWRHGSSDRGMREIVSRAYDYHTNKTTKAKPCKFNVGDLVRLVAGKAKMKVLGVRTSASGNEIRADYVSRIGRGYVPSRRWRPEHDYVHFNKNTDNETSKEKETTEMKSKLYQTKEETARFGTLLATNSQGKLVLEMKGTGEVLAFDRDQVEVVMPYTFGVKFPNNHTEYHYLGKDGEVAVNDMVMLDNSSTGKFEIARVTSVNTRSEAATVVFKGSKLLTQRIGD